VLLSDGDAPLTTIQGFPNKDSFLEMENALPAVYIKVISIPIIQGAALVQCAITPNILVEVTAKIIA
jgi:hypothetical protein